MVALDSGPESLNSSWGFKAHFKGSCTVVLKEFEVPFGVDKRKFGVDMIRSGRHLQARQGEPTQTDGDY